MTLIKTTIKQLRHLIKEEISKLTESKQIDAFAPAKALEAKPAAAAKAEASGKQMMPENGVPFEFYSVRNTVKSPNVGARFGQNVEPHGKYMTAANPDSAKNLPDNFQHGVIRFESPLVVEFGAGYGEATNWKNVLAKRFGKKGKALSQAIRDAGYDGIVTTEPSKGQNRPAHTSEIVDLRGFKPT